MWRKREIMELQDKTSISALVDIVPTDVSGKWVKKEELYPFAAAVAAYVLARVETELNDPNI